GGAKMHAAKSGTIDYREPNDDACLERVKRLVGMLPAEQQTPEYKANSFGWLPASYEIFSGSAEYDVRDLLKLILDDAPFDEYKAEYGQSLVCGFGKLGGIAVGVVANQKKRVKPAEGALQFGGVIYVDSADKAARFIMDCNQLRAPILFIQNVNGFMV